MEKRLSSVPLPKWSVCKQSRHRHGHLGQVDDDVPVLLLHDQDQIATTSRTAAALEIADQRFSARQIRSGTCRNCLRFKAWRARQRSSHTRRQYLKGRFRNGHDGHGIQDIPLSWLTSRLSCAISCCSGFIWPWPRKGLHRIGAELLHPFAQNILMNVQVSGGLRR